MRLICVNSYFFGKDESQIAIYNGTEEVAWQVETTFEHTKENISNTIVILKKTGKNETSKCALEKLEKTLSCRSAVNQTLFERRCQVVK